jgi:hypothetical protein
MGTAPECVGLERDLQNKRTGGKLCAGNCPAPFPLDGRGSRQKNQL